MLIIKTQYIRAWLLLCLMLSSIAGCSTWVGSDFKDPEIQLTKVELVKKRVLEQEFLLRYRIYNPNDVSLPIRRLSYSVYLGDIELATGEGGSWAEIPPNSYAYYEVPVQTNLWRQMKQVMRLLKKSDQPIPYTMDGEIHSGLVFGRSVPVSSKGELNQVTTVALE